MPASSTISPTQLIYPLTLTLSRRERKKMSLFTSNLQLLLIRLEIGALDIEGVTPELILPLE